jgi:hypothetical protein
VIPDRDTQVTARPVVDILVTGYSKFQTSSLATFNKKIADIQQGRTRQAEPDTDEITPCQVVDNAADDEDDPDPSDLGKLSELHED